MASSSETLRGRSVLITGGLGFLGSTLAIRLVHEGADVAILDNFLPGQGANWHNIEPIRDRVHVTVGDIRDERTVRRMIESRDIIFHLAGQVNHVRSMEDPLEDLDINGRGTLVILEACKKYNPNARILFTGTRGQYGPSTKLPVAEDHPMNPKGIYAITNMAAEKMVQVYHSVHGVKGVCVRITNTYGPRHQMRHDQYGVANWFIRRAMDGKPIHLFGDGSIIRDYVYVDDTIEALMRLAVHDESYGEIYNVGGGAPTIFAELAATIVEVIGRGSIERTPFTKERKELEPGDFVADITKIRKDVGWHPTTDLRTGIQQTAKFYETHRAKYW